MRNAEGQSVQYIGFPEAQLGLIPAVGGAYLAIEIVGLARAKELFFGAKQITAQYAEQIGLINAVVNRERLLQEAEELARQILDNSCSSLVLTKRLLYLCRDRSRLEGALRETAAAFAECCISGDKDERIARLNEERRWRFRNSVSADLH